MSTTISNDVKRILDKTVTVSAVTQLYHADSGTTYFLNAAAGVAITLPAVKAGVSFKFITAASFITTAWTVTGGAAVIQGSIIVNGAKIAGANETTITFAHAAETVGDHVELQCDGTNWFLSGVADAAGGITLA